MSAVNPVQTEGLAAWDVGVSVTAARNDGSKRPRSLPIPPTCSHPVCAAKRAAAAGERRAAWGWKHLTHERLERRAVAGLLAHAQGLCVITGAVSGNLLMVETDAPEMAELLRSAAADVGLGDLMRRVDEGRRERTPKGGTHWFVRLDLGAGETMPGNEKLARRPKRADEMADEHDLVQVLIETRGEGGQVVCAPSHGRTHPTGLPYVLEAGDWKTIPTLSSVEWAALRAVAVRLDEMPVVEPRRSAPRRSRTSRDANTPMERFNAEATWAEILERHGWALLAEDGSGEQFWSRPGKTPRGVSATARADGPLYVFTSSTVFEPEQAYSKFAAYAVLEHGGDMSTAAATLRAWWNQQKQHAS